MIVASIDDLLLEQWLRRRNDGQIVWVTKENKIIPIKNMSDSHLDNTIKMIKRKYKHDWEYYEALGSIGEL